MDAASSPATAEERREKAAEAHSKRNLSSSIHVAIYTSEDNGAKNSIAKTVLTKTSTESSTARIE